jgi:magnesium chelatase family protein
VLFLDELLEFPRSTLDALRQPLEDGRVLLARATGAVVFPARFALVAAANPCPCGRAGEPGDRCMCTPADVARYRGRLSGPLSDRIDMHVHVGAVAPRAMHGARVEEASSTIRARVEAARAAQQRRFRDLAGIASNAQVGGRWLDTHGGITAEARELLVAASERLALSARAHFRVMKVARTIADLDDDAMVTVRHMSEALRSRPLSLETTGAHAAAAVRAAR